MSAPHRPASPRANARGAEAGFSGSRSPSGAPLRHSPRLLPLGSAPGRASWKPGANGRTLPGASAASTSRTGHNAGRDDARSRPGAGLRAPPAGTASRSASGSSLETPSMSEIGRNVTEQRTDVNNMSPISRHIIVIYFLPRRRRPALALTIVRQSPKECR